MQNLIKQYDIKTLVVESVFLKNAQQKNFAITSLLLNNIFFEESDFLYLFYLQEINSYEIVLSKEKLELFDILILDLEENENSFFLFRINGLFLIFKSSLPYYIQKANDDISDEELLEYIKNRLKIDISKQKNLNSNDFKNLLENFLKSPQKKVLTNINEKKSLQFKIFLFYISSLLFVFILYFYFEKEEESPKIMNIKDKKYEKYLPIYDRFDKIQNSLQEYNLELVSFIYEKNSLKLTFQSISKNDIYSFLILYKTLLNDSSITYIENVKKYECIIDIRKF